MSTPLFHVTIQPSSLPGHSLYPKLAAVKLEDPQLQPVVEKKGCERILANMRDCLVETHCWEKCNVEVEKFQECINTRYFEDNEKNIEPAENAVKNEELRLEEATEKNGTQEEDANQIISTGTDELVESEEGNNEEKALIESEPHELSVDENEVESVMIEESDQDGKEDDIVDKESFRVKIVSKTDENAEVDQNLLFNISVSKSTLQCSDEEGANIEISNPKTEDERTKIETISLKSDEEETNSLTTDEGTNLKTNSPDDEGTSSPETDDGTKLEE